MVETAVAAGDGWPDPVPAGTAVEFVAVMRRLKDWSGLGYRRLEKAAEAVGHVLPRSTLTVALRRDTLPRPDLVAALVRACGGDEAEAGRWLAVRRRIAATPMPESASEPSHPGASATPQPARCTLPAEPGVFVGRDRELDQIAAAIADAAEAGGVIAIHAIDGMPGIGKTALAVHVAHRLKGRFGDRQLFVDLYAHTPGRSPTEPADALAELLTADGVDPACLPATLDARAALWRDRMTGRRLLLVLDNAAGTAQVLPLLPGSPDCLILITSRRSLGDLPAAVPIGLDVLTTDEAVAMFQRLAPRATDRQAVAGLVRACGHLPLAISITASLYSRHRSWTLDDLRREVSGPAGDLLTVTAENRTVAAVFDLSYQHLPAGRQHMFRMLGLHPGVDIDAHAAAALAGVTLDEARLHLAGLHRDHLLEEPGYHRYRMHDLVRAHAAGLAAQEEPPPRRRAALGRLLDHYRHTAAVAMDIVHPHGRTRRPNVPAAASATPHLRDRDQAERWLDAELPNLLAAARHAAGHQWPEHLWHLAAVLHRQLRTRGRYAEAAALHRDALTLARRHGDQRAELDAHNGLGHVHRVLDRYEEAGDHYGHALRLAQTLGDHIGELDALTGLAYLHRMQGRLQQAVEDYSHALRIARAIGDECGELDALTGCGHVHLAQGCYEQAAGHYRRALRIAQTIDDDSGQLQALNGLGHVHLALGHYEQAADRQDRALDLAQRSGNLIGQLNALHGLGHVLLALGRYEKAADHYRRALRIAQTIEHHSGELNALIGSGHVHLALGEHRQAAGCYQQVLERARLLRNSNWQFEAHQGLGRLNHAIGLPRVALTHHQRALQHATDLVQPVDQARAHDGLAHAHHALSQHDQAGRHWQHALDILTSLGTHHSEDIQTSIPKIRAHLARLPQPATTD